MTIAAWQAVADGWTAKQIHDTVAAIVRQRAYAVPVRQTLLGSIVRFIGERLRELSDLLGGSHNTRIIIIVAVGLLVLAIVGRLLVTRRGDSLRRSASGAQIVGTQGRDYWAIAAELEKRHDFTGASHAVYLAVLDALVRSGGVTFHPSKTVGDYVRDLRQRRSTSVDAFRDFGRRFERDVFGAEPPDAASYGRLVELAAFAKTARAA